MRVSTFRPAHSNSFQNLVPVGKRHASTSETSIFVPSGNWTHRDFAAPSDHSGYCGTNGRLRGSIIKPGPSVTYSPVPDSRSGSGCALLAGLPDAKSTAIIPITTRMIAPNPAAIFAPDFFAFITAPPEDRSAAAHGCESEESTADRRRRHADRRPLPAGTSDMASAAGSDAPALHAGRFARC